VATSLSDRLNAMDQRRAKTFSKVRQSTSNRWIRKAITSEPSPARRFITSVLDTEAVPYEQNRIFRNGSFEVLTHFVLDEANLVIQIGERSEKRTVFDNFLKERGYAILYISWRADFRQGGVARTIRNAVHGRAKYIKANGMPKSA
jgi:hypothetical protein